ncbi:MAG: TIGR01777 family oxidoreductase [Desulfovibrio sp.]|nr:TIGR01777 family oxidoreductase [Desulfovibrio sp.]
MHILILGSTGFIGSQMTARFLEQGHTVRAVVRSNAGNRPARPGLSYAPWDGKTTSGLLPLLPLLEDIDAVINLQGENIGAGRWTAPRKQAIVQSRLNAGHALTAALQARRDAGLPLPRTMLQASACGYYGLWPDAASAPACEENSPQGQGFLAETCALWEESTALVETMGIRRCVLRFSPVIGQKTSGAAGGFLERMLPPFLYFLGGPVGSGRQPMSWVHMADVVHAAQFLLEGEDLKGIFNISAPSQADMRQFARDLGKACSRPAWLPVPGFILRLALGQMAEELVLNGQKSVPARLTQSGYIFRYPSLEQALADTLRPRA